MTCLDELASQLNTQQPAINIIQATLITQQQDIADIKTTLANSTISINHIINSLSELATKFNIQITLLPPLPLSSTPPTSLPAIVATSATAACYYLAHPNPPVVAAASPTSPTFILDATSHNSAPPSLTLTPPIFSYAIGSDKTATTGNNPSTLLSNLARHFSFAVIKSTTNGLYEVLFLGVGDLENNSRMMFYKVLGAKPAMNHTGLNEQKWTDARNMFVLLLEKKDKTIFEKALFVLDPGGTFNFESIYDLEDKVDFEGSVMIGLRLRHQPIGPRHMQLHHQLCAPEKICKYVIHVQQEI